jgi:hypothetical protein
MWYCRQRCNRGTAMTAKKSRTQTCWRQTAAIFVAALSSFRLL